MYSLSPSLPPFLSLPLPPSLSLSDHVLDGDMNQSSPLHRRKIVKKEKRKKVVSKSLENVYEINIQTVVAIATIV